MAKFIDFLHGSCDATFGLKASTPENTVTIRSVASSIDSHQRALVNDALAPMSTDSGAIGSEGVPPPVVVPSQSVAMGFEPVVFAT